MFTQAAQDLNPHLLRLERSARPIELTTHFASHVRFERLFRFRRPTCVHYTARENIYLKLSKSNKKGSYLSVAPLWFFYVSYRLFVDRTLTKGSCVSIMPVLDTKAFTLNNLSLLALYVFRVEHVRFPKLSLI